MNEQTEIFAKHNKYTIEIVKVMNTQLLYT